MPQPNKLLASLSGDDTNLIQPHLRRVQLQQEHVLYETGDRVSTVYFPTSAIVSLVVMLASGQTVEAAMVGSDGVVAASAALDGRLSLNRAIVQLSGNAMACDVAAIKAAALQSPTIFSMLIRHEQAVYAQAQQSVACIASHALEARLCRWLLRARDLSGSDTLLFTQEFLAEMLGVSRPTVSVVAHTLQQAGLIKYARGRIQIIDVDGLEETTCECYQAIRDFYRALLHN